MQNRRLTGGAYLSGSVDINGSSIIEESTVPQESQQDYITDADVYYKFIYKKLCNSEYTYTQYNILYERISEKLVDTRLSIDEIMAQYAEYGITPPTQEEIEGLVTKINRPDKQSTLSAEGAGAAEGSPDHRPSTPPTPAEDASLINPAPAEAAESEGASDHAPQRDQSPLSPQAHRSPPGQGMANLIGSMHNFVDNHPQVSSSGSAPLRPALQPDALVPSGLARYQ